MRSPPSHQDFRISYNTKGVPKLTNVVVRSLLIKQRVRKGFFFVFLVFFLPLGKKDLLHVLAHNFKWL